MDRPGSRGSVGLSQSGLKAPTGSSVPMPDRPTTGQRGPGGGGGLGASGTGSLLGQSQIGGFGPAGGGAGRAPGTAMRASGGSIGAPPGSAYKRLGTAQGGRPGTGSQGAGANGARLGTAVTVDNRPITNHGVSGMRQKNTGGGAGRQVLDKAYFIGELRQKRLEIITVTQSMKEEYDALEKRQGQYNLLDKRGTDLSREVKILQEALADYNTVLDKVGSQTPVYAITGEHAELKARNDVQRKRVDDILTERLNLEQKTKKAESKIAEIQQSIDSRLESMPPSQRTQYGELSGEQATMGADAKRFEEAIDELDKQLATNEGELARNPLKQRSLQLQEQIRTLTERKYELQQEEERSKQSPEDQREQLMGKIKRDNAEVETVTAQVKDLQDTVKKMEARNSGMGGQGSINNAAEEASRREKFEELVAKERDLNNFMDGFPSVRSAKASERQSKEDAILALLDKITKMSAMTTSALPTQRKFKEMQDELEYKKMQLENTQSTQERLKEELTMRRTELEKIDTLEDKIRLELVQLGEKSIQLQAAIAKFQQVHEIKERSEAARARLERLKAALLKRKDLLRTIVGEKNLKHQAKRAQLSENNLQINLEKMETKLRALHTNIYEVSQFVQEKEAQTNYRVLAMNITAMVDELNVSVKRAIA